MKRFRELLVVAGFVGGLAALLSVGALIAQTSLTDVRGALQFISFDPQVRWVGNLTFEKNDGTDAAELTDTGIFHLVETSDVAPTPDLSSDAEIALFSCNDTLVIQYNNGGTLTYLTIDLDGSDTSWAHSTTAPATCAVNL